MLKKSTLLFCSALTLLSSTSVIAEDDKKEKKDKIWSGDVELGYVSINGNSEETSVKSKADINREKEIWRYNIHMESLNTKSDDIRSAEKYFLSNRLGRVYSKTDYTFAYSSYDEDHFSGFDYQATVALGWGRRLIDNESMHWDVEAGPGYRISKVEDESTADDSEEAIIRAFSKFSWQFTDTATVSQAINVEAGGNNTITKADSALRVKINGSLSLKLFHSIKYTEDVPPGTKHADTETGATLTYSF